MEDNKALILYKSKYGSTKKYAEMLQSRLNCDIFNLDNSQNLNFKNYDTIIFAGAIYASGIAGINSLRKNYEELKDKKLAILCVGASPYEEKALEEIKIKNLKSDLIHIPLYYARGAWDESKMTIRDKLLCKMLIIHIRKKDPKTYEPWMKALVEAIGNQCDWVDEKYLRPLIEYIQR